VRFCLDAGIRQFLDIGAGIPTAGAVHEVARRVAPDTRVVYVDVDPVAVAHGQAILRDDAQAAAIPGDLRRPAEILADPQVARLIDFSRPVAVLLLAVLHFIPDEDGPAGLVHQLAERLVPGSYVVVSHGTPEERPDHAEAVGQLYKNTSAPLSLRRRTEIHALFGDLVLVEPGLTWVTAWHASPGEDVGPERREMLVGVGLRPHRAG
jgi:hypothetical protein